MEPNFLNQTNQAPEELAPQKPRNLGLFGFIKKYWFLLFLACFATLLGLLWYTTNVAREPKNVELPEKIEHFDLVGQPIALGTQIAFNFSGQYTDSLPLLQIEKKPPMGLTEASQLASSFGFEGTPKTATDAITGTLWTWRDTGKSLTITTSSREVDFLIDQREFPSTATGVFPDTDSLLKSSEPVLSVLGISLDGIKTEELFLGSEGLWTEGNEGEPIYKAINLRSTFNGTELIQFTGQDYVASLFFNSEGRLIKLNSINNIVRLVPTAKSYPIKSREEIISTLKADGRIFSGVGNISPEELQTITITGLASAYLVPKEESASHPLFVMSGTAIDVSGVTHNIKLILPAIKRELYK